MISLLDIEDYPDIHSYWCSRNESLVVGTCLQQIAISRGGLTLFVKVSLYHHCVVETKLGEINKEY